jgi:hypothetical protein
MLLDQPQCQHINGSFCSLCTIYGDPHTYCNFTKFHAIFENVIVITSHSLIDLIKKSNMFVKSRILHPEAPFNSQPTLLHTAVQEPHQGEEEKALSSFQLNNTVTPAKATK